jgi:hypothetical protein
VGVTGGVSVLSDILRVLDRESTCRLVDADVVSFVIDAVIVATVGKIDAVLDNDPAKLVTTLLVALTLLVAAAVVVLLRIAVGVKGDMVADALTEVRVRDREPAVVEIETGRSGECVVETPGRLAEGVNVTLALTRESVAVPEKPAVVECFVEIEVDKLREFVNESEWKREVVPLPKASVAEITRNALKTKITATKLTSRKRQLIL